MRLKITRTVACLAFILLCATAAFAGPPLLCHSFDIGDAKSLPWISQRWNLTGTETYDNKNLATDTLSILDANSTVIVHMETLRRAALYAQKDPSAAKQLLLKLIARSDAASKHTSGSALALFDEGYFAATLDQLHWVEKDFANPAKGLDAYALVKKAIGLSNGNAQMHFGAALMTLDDPSADQAGHAKMALVGAQSDPLLARNLATHFMGPQTETMAQMINRNSATKAARE